MATTSFSTQLADIRDDNVLYHHRKIDEFDDDEKKAKGNLTHSNMSVENILFNGTMEKDDLSEDVVTMANGTQQGDIHEEKHYIDLGEKWVYAEEGDIYKEKHFIDLGEKWVYAEEGRIHKEKHFIDLGEKWVYAEERNIHEEKHFIDLGEKWVYA